MTADVQQILDEAAERIGGATSCSVILRMELGLRRVASSDPRAAACDDAEVAERGGPCVLAMDQLSGVIVPDVSLETRWAGWVAAAQAGGFRSGAALPAYVQDGVTLALNLYAETLDPWDAEALVRADGFAQELARAVREHGLAGR
ncbi:GAF domain-containing protein [Actinotalea fermentans]|uniref:GAF domain-containing protein n=1 Tax=Actinotalea fermentans TaxID=43671 RepID=UPI00068DE44A|nr:GAF domain-containing protein [Actinotalea fermentans]